MKPQSLIFGFGIVLMLSGACFSIIAKPGAGDPVPYRLLAGSTLIIDTGTTGGGSLSQTSVLSGVFTLIKQVSPLDWDNYSLEEVRCQAALNSTNVIRLAGTGSYSVTARFGDTKQLNLTLRINDVAVQLQSGAVANDPNWPMIDIWASGAVPSDASTNQYAIHLVAAPELQVWHYRLLETSYFMDDCPICDRVSIQEPLRGGFDLVLIDTNPLYSRYILRDMSFISSWAGNTRLLTGQGTYQIGGEVGLNQNMTLQMTVKSTIINTNEDKTFTNSISTVPKRWPVMEVSLDETAGTLAHVYRLHLVAAPLREIWFSTAHDLTSGNGAITNKLVSHGDLLSDLEPRPIVRSNSDLLAAFHLSPTFAPVDTGIDAVAIAPGGEVQFSLNSDLQSSTLGTLHHGDLLSERGYVVKRNQELLSAFAVMPPVPDVGLDALQIMDDGEILFSINTDIFAEKPGAMLAHGDLLSIRGEIRKTNAQLLSQFHPDKTGHDYGLDAVYVWPSGEIWFSTEEGFNDQQLGAITDGDLLSDQGYVVFRNLELVSTLAPLEDLANFGLDALYLVTDASAPAPAPSLLRPTLDSVNNSISFQWTGKGRVFQVESTPELGWPFNPVSLILPGTSWTDTGSSPTMPRAFYRLRQW